MSNLGSIAGETGDEKCAVALQEESLSIFRELNDRRGIALTMGNLAEAYASLGDLDTACRLHQESTTLMRPLGAMDSLAIALGNLARVQIRRRNEDEGRRALDECLQLCGELGNRVEMAMCMETFAELAVWQGHMRRAARLFGKGDSLYRESGVVRKLRPYPTYSADCGRVREVLGEATYAELWRQGAAMTDAEATAMARSNDTV